MALEPWHTQDKITVTQSCYVKSSIGVEQLMFQGHHRDVPLQNLSDGAT